MDNLDIDFVVVKLILPLGALAFLILVGCLYYKNETRRVENAHVERMKVLELGLPLPDADLARYKAENNKTATAGAVAMVVPFTMAASAVGVTALILARASELPLQIALLCTVWGVCGLVSLVTVVLGLVVLGRLHSSKALQKSIKGESPLAAPHAREAIVEESAQV
jgi:hypothetical protein